MFQEVPLYNEFVICFSYFFIVILTNNVFRDDEEDKTGASMTNTIIDDQQVSTFVGQWNVYFIHVYFILTNYEYDVIHTIMISMMSDLPIPRNIS